VATIARAHVAARLLSPCASEPVRLALKEMGRVTSSRQHQALALGWAEIKDFIKLDDLRLRSNGRGVFFLEGHSLRFDENAE
jgi:hypothetical protein